MTAVVLTVKACYVASSVVSVVCLLLLFFCFFLGGGGGGGGGGFLLISLAKLVTFMCPIFQSCFLSDCENGWRHSCEFRLPLNFVSSCSTRLYIYLETPHPVCEGISSNPILRESVVEYKSYPFLFVIFPVLNISSPGAGFTVEADSTQEETSLPRTDFRKGHGELEGYPRQVSLLYVPHSPAGRVQTRQARATPRIRERRD